MKRYCQTLTLKNDPQLVKKYIEVHSHVWPEIIDGQHEVGILSMEIYANGRNLFMIVDTVDAFDWDRDMARLATLPRQASSSSPSTEATSASRCRLFRPRCKGRKGLCAGKKRSD